MLEIVLIFIPNANHHESNEMEMHMMLGQYSTRIALDQDLSGEKIRMIMWHQKLANYPSIMKAVESESYWQIHRTCNLSIPHC